MFRLLLSLVLASCCLNGVAAADRPEWAFFVPAASPIPKDAWPELSDPLNPPDLYPREHPTMPEVVARGTQSATGGAALLPCALCHLPNGAGHVESASLAGLSPNYIARQFEDIRSGARQITVGDPHAMNLITTLKRGFAAEQVSVAAHYFSSLKPRPWIRVVASSVVPGSYVNPVTLMRLPVPNGGTEALGRRIVELPENPLGLINRDSHAGYVAYVPEGSLAAGEALVTKGGPGRTLACASCHGPKLTGLGDIPPLAGRPPSYIVRQLWAFQSGTRAGELSAGMKPVVVNLTADEMLDIAAYLASLPPR